MLANLINVPKTPHEWEIWSWSHRASHDLIRQAIEQRGGPVQTDYVVHPIDTANFPQFLQNNQVLHITMLAALGLQSSDIEEVDPYNEEQMAVWTVRHYLDHYDTEKSLGISS